MHTAYRLIASAAARTPEHLALVDDVSDRRFSYLELLDEVDSVAAGLLSLGVRAGMRFATVLPNSLEHCLLILALDRLGAVPALMNARLSTVEIASLVEDGKMAGAVAQGATLSAIKEVLGAAAPLLDPNKLLDECRGNPRDLPPVPNPNPEDPAFIFYTSGTTGLPKGVLLPHRTTLPRIVWLSALAYVQYGSDLRVLGLAPLAHAIGFHGNFLASLAYNGTYYLVSQFDPATANDLIEQNRISFLFTVPTFFHAMLNTPNYAPERFASVKQLLWGGAAIHPGLLERLDDELDAQLVHIYGTTETMCSLYNPQPVGQPTRVRPGLFSQTRVIEFDGKPTQVVAPGAEGELIVHTGADTAFAGYLDNPEATADKVRDGWYYTGDACQLRRDGDLELIGRVDDVIRSGGENIHPDEVEAVLSEHPDVLDVGVVGTDDEHWGQRVVAHVVAKHASLSADDLDQYCQSTALARYKRPREYVFVERLPRNAANKLLRRALREKDA